MGSGSCPWNISFLGNQGYTLCAAHREWHIANPDEGYLAPAKALALTAVDLLWQDAAAALRILELDRPRMTKEQYLDLQRGVFRTEVYPAATSG